MLFFKKTKWKGFLIMSKEKRNFFQLIKKLYGGEKWPNKVEIDQKNPKKIYVALELKQKLTCFCTLLKN